MKVINATYEILNPIIESHIARNAIYQAIETAGRTCYKSESNITPESAAKFVKRVVENGHEAMLEHASMTVRFIVDRGVSHELVRHRVASFAQESTRYCNYSQDKFGNEITVIAPVFYNEVPKVLKFEIGQSVAKRAIDFNLLADISGNDLAFRYYLWLSSCLDSEKAYFYLLEKGATPQEARAVLPNSLKTEVIMTANMREWRHFFKLRAAGETGKPHPQMLEVAVPLLKECQESFPELFGDIKIKEE